MSERIRVLFIAGNLDRGGAEKQLVSLLSHIDPDVIDARLVSLSRSSGEHHEDTVHESGVWFRAMPARHGQLYRFNELRRIIGSWRPHIVWAWHFFTGVYALPWVLPRKGTKLVVGLRNDAAYLLKVHPWALRLMRLADAAVANTEVVFTQLDAMGSRPSRWFVLPNTLDRIEGPVDISETVTRVGYTGNIHERKGLDVFIRAAKVLCDGGYGGRFVIAGKGDKTELETLAVRLGISDRVDFFGPVDCASFVRGLDVFVLPSRHEGCPNVLLEAFASGVPCVATAVGGVPEVMTDGVNGLLVGPESPEAMARAIGRLVADRDLRAGLGRKAHASVCRDRDPELIARGVLPEILRSILEKKGPEKTLGRYAPTALDRTGGGN